MFHLEFTSASRTHDYPIIRTGFLTQFMCVDLMEKQMRGDRGRQDGSLACSLVAGWCVSPPQCRCGHADVSAKIGSVLSLTITHQSSFNTEVSEPFIPYLGEVCLDPLTFPEVTSEDYVQRKRALVCIYHRSIN